MTSLAAVAREDVGRAQSVALTRVLPPEGGLSFRDWGHAQTLALSDDARRDLKTCPRRGHAETLALSHDARRDLKPRPDPGDAQTLASVLSDRHCLVGALDLALASVPSERHCLAGALDLAPGRQGWCPGRSGALLSVLGRSQAFFCDVQWRLAANESSSGQ